MKWWARANEKDPNAHTGYYIGIYAMLGVVGMICLIVSCWLVSPFLPAQTDTDAV